MVYVASRDPGKVTVEGGGAGWAGKEVALMQPSGAFGALFRHGWREDWNRFGVVLLIVVGDSVVTERETLREKKSCRHCVLRWKDFKERETNSLQIFIF
jgi:hypothetical protein